MGAWKGFFGVLALGGAALCAPVAQAGTISNCITVDAVALSQPYNPFASGGIVQTINLTVRRLTSGDPKTTEAQFVFVQPQDDSSPYQIKQGSVNVLYPYPGPLLNAGGANPNVIVVDFGGQAANAVQTVPITFSIPPGADLAAGPFIIPFGIDAVCKQTGTGGTETTTGTLVSPFTLSMFVRSALQAYYAGPALDFGPIGGVSNTLAPSHAVAGIVHVASSGPYTVALTSDNNYRMTFPGGNLGQVNQRVGYSLSFLGQTHDFAAPGFTLASCRHPGLGGEDLGISVTLEDGGAGKAPAPNYQDMLTLTITPLAVPPEDNFGPCS